MRITINQKVLGFSQVKQLLVAMTVITAHIHRALITLLGHSSSPHLSFGGVITGNSLTGEEADAQGYLAIRRQIQDSSPDALAIESWFVNHPIPADTRAQIPVGL